MQVAVFGAAGWVGRAVLANLRGRHWVRSVVLNEAAWNEWEDLDGCWHGDEVCHGDIADFTTVHRATLDMQAIIHLSVHFPSQTPGEVRADNRAFLVNLKGLWNTLESARERGIRKIVHAGSCAVSHPHGKFFSAEVRSAEGDLYGICKRLQEEMCRQFHDAHGMHTVVLRPDYIVDSRLGLGRFREALAGHYRPGWICRHDLAEALRLALEADTEHQILHVAGTPEAATTCDLETTFRILNWRPKANLEQYRTTPSQHPADEIPKKSSGA